MDRNITHRPGGRSNSLTMRLSVATLGVFCMAAACNEAQAEIVTFKCDAPSRMTLVYEGDGAGTLTVKDSFGEMSLPARKETREGQGDDGTKMTATGIAAFGLVSAIMPDKAAIEACVNDKLPPDQLQDADIVFTAVLGCAGTAPRGQKPVQVNANVEISVVEPPGAYVFITRTFVEPSSLAGGKIELSSMPPPRCVLAKE